MDKNERELIDGLFGKLRQVDGQAPQRDAEAEAFIRQQVAQLPAAPYYMAQAILVQEQALEATQQRVRELESQIAQQPTGGGSFLGGLFGGGRQAVPSPATRSRIPQSGGMGYGRPGFGGGFGGGGGGFLAGAAQTAMGVAGGILVADAISSAFGGGAAEAATPPADEPPPEEDAGFDDATADMGEEW
jgi:hypothetical protein